MVCNIIIPKSGQTKAVGILDYELTENMHHAVLIYFSANILMSVLHIIPKVLIIYKNGYSLLKIISGSARYHK